MAIDVIVRPEGSCISIVSDRLKTPITSVAIIGSTIRADLEDGTVMPLGELTEDMRLDAGRCTLCFVIEMEGYTAIGSRRVDFSMSN